ncbi:MAG: hypothetical protein V7742_22470 [Halioglobus sp.]
MPEAPLARLFASAAGGITLLSCLLLLAAIFLSPATFLHDFGEWVFQGKILSLKFAAPEQVTAYTLYNYPVPYSTAQYFLALLHLVFPPLLAGKILIAMYIVGWCAAAEMFCRRYFDEPTQRRLAWVILVCLAAFSSFFYYGYIGYQLGLLLLVAFLAFYHAATSPLMIGIFGVVLFFTHATIFLQFGLLVFLGVALNRFPLRQLMALLPCVFLGLAFLAGRFLADSVPLPVQSNWDGWLEAAIYKAGMVTMQGPFKNFAFASGATLLEDYPTLYWSGVVINAGTALLLGLLFLRVFWRVFSGGLLFEGRSEPTRVFCVFLLGMSALYLLAPYNFLGLVHPAGRVILPLMVVLLALTPVAGVRFSGLAVSVLALSTLVTSAAYFKAVTSYDSLADLASEVPSSPPAELASSVMAYNQWLYRNTRYSYYNYRVFVLKHRYDQLQAEDYRGLGFRSGPIADYQTTDRLPGR